MIDPGNAVLNAVVVIISDVVVLLWRRQFVDIQLLTRDTTVSVLESLASDSFTTAAFGPTSVS
jgi:hypothetical protein